MLFRGLAQLILVRRKKQLLHSTSPLSSAAYVPWQSAAVPVPTGFLHASKHPCRTMHTKAPSQHRAHQNALTALHAHPEHGGQRVASPCGHGPDLGPAAFPHLHLPWGRADDAL